MVLMMSEVGPGGEPPLHTASLGDAGNELEVLLGADISETLAEDYAAVAGPAAALDATGKKPAITSQPDFSEGDLPDDTPDLDKQTGPSPDSVRIYLKQIDRVALLDAEEEVDLAKRIEAGLYAGRLLVDPSVGMAPARRRDLQWIAEDGAAAKNHLLEANLRLVVSLAKRYTGRGMAFLDLIQEGNLGLIHAVEKFDYTKGYKFSTYAAWWIRQAITNGMADQSRTIRLPVGQVEIINKLARRRRLLGQNLGREPTTEELAKEMDMTPKKIAELIRYAATPIPLDEALQDGEDDRTLHDVYGVEDSYPLDEKRRRKLEGKLHGILPSILNERELGVVRLRFGLEDGQPRSLGEVGATYGVSNERIRQNEKAALKKLRLSDHTGFMREYLDLLLD